MNERTAPIVRLMKPHGRNLDKSTFHKWATGKIRTETAILRFRIANNIPQDTPIDRDAFEEMMRETGYIRWE